MEISSRIFAKKLEQLRENKKTFVLFFVIGLLTVFVGLFFNNFLFVTIGACIIAFCSIILWILEEFKAVVTIATIEEDIKEKKVKGELI